MAMGNFLWPHEVSYGHTTPAAVTGDFLSLLLWPQEISDGHKKPMAMGDFRWLEKIFYGWPYDMSDSAPPEDA